MSLYLIRHGIAENFANTDFERELTVEGRIKLAITFEKFAKNFKDKNVLVYSSPLIRAKQTAEILCQFLECDFILEDELAYGDYSEFIKKIYKDKDKEYILVGHEPKISNCIYKIKGRYEIISRGSIHIL